MKSAENTQHKKGRPAKVFDILLIAVILCMMGVIGYIMYQSHSGKAVSFFGKSVLVVVTGSMEPSISEGDHIIIEKCDASALREGDIITFTSHETDINGRLVTHRIIAVNPDGSFETKGDANPVADGYTVKPADIEGRYIGRARAFDVIGSFASPQKLLMVFVMIPLALVSLYEVKSLMKLLLQSRAEEKLSDEELKQQLIREEIEKEKQRLREQAVQGEEVKSDESGGDNET